MTTLVTSKVLALIVKKKQQAVSKTNTSIEMNDYYWLEMISIAV